MRAGRADVVAMVPVGVQDEENSELDRTRSAAVRKRSLRLLGELLRPERTTFILTVVLVVVATVL